MSDDDDDMLEQAFAELQENLNEQDAAETEAARISMLQPGDSDYDGIRSDYKHVADPDKATRAEIEKLVQQWFDHKDELALREAELYDTLTSAGFDMRTYYIEHHIKPKMRRLEREPSEVAMRSSVDALLAKTNPQEIVSHTGSIKTFVPSGASGYVGKTDEEELAEVDVLDSAAVALDNDCPSDKLCVYTDTNDANEIDKPVMQDDTGAYWFKGFRMHPLLRGMLKPHQQGAIDACLNALLGGAHGVLVAHGMGLGKTLSMIATLEMWSSRFKTARAIVCCPKSLIYQWSAEFAKWESVIFTDNYCLTEKDAGVIRFLKPWYKHGGVVIVGHDQFKRMYEHFNVNKDTIVVVDEAHILKHIRTDIYQVIKNLPTSRKLFLTGSPVQNNLVEYYNLIELLAPGILGSTPSEFVRMYETPIQAGMSKTADADVIKEANATIKALRQRLNMPDASNSMVVVHEQSSLEILEDTIGPKVEFCLFHACSGTVLQDPNVINERHNVCVAARPEKIYIILQLIKSIRRNTDDNIVVFSTRNDLLKDLQALEDGYLLTGEMDISRRDKVLQDYPSKPGDIIYMATLAGGVGIHLTAASRVILADVSWNPVDSNQAIARCWRMGQKKSVYVYRLVANDTLEKGIYRNCIKKHCVAIRITSDADVQRSFTRQDLYALMNEPDDDAFSISFSDCTDAVLQDFDAPAAACTQMKIFDHNKNFIEYAEETGCGDGDECDDDEINMYNIMSQHSARRGTRKDGSVQLIGFDEYMLDDGTLCPPHAPTFFKCIDEKSAKFGPAVVFAHDESAYICIEPLVKDTRFFSSPQLIAYQLEYIKLAVIRCPQCHCRLLTLEEAVEEEESIKCTNCDTVFVNDSEEADLFDDDDDDDVFDGLFAEIDNEGKESWAYIHEAGDERWHKQPQDLSKPLSCNLFNLEPKDRIPGYYKYRVAYLDTTNAEKWSSSTPSPYIQYLSGPL